MAGVAHRFRTKIWEKATGDVVYDNQMDADDGADPRTAIVEAGRVPGIRDG